jgi:hypothetical protein
MADSLSASERKAIAEAAIEYARRVLADTDIPTDAEIDAMSLDDLVAYLDSAGVTLDLDRMESEAWAAVGRDAAALEREQMSPARREQLAKRVASEVQRQAVSVANQTMGSLRQQAIDATDDRPEDERWLMWVTVNGDNACPDCQDLHGYVDTADGFEGNSPRDGHTVCGGNCKCSLVPCGAPASPGERVSLERGRGLPTR